MIILIASSLPLFVLAALLLLNRWKINDEKVRFFLVTIPICLVISVIGQFFGTSNQAKFREVWNFKVNTVRYYERWNEKVKCTHAVYRTEYYTDHYTDSQGKRKTRRASRRVFSHWQHPFDVDDHPPRWEAEDERGTTHSIDQATFESWCALWGNKKFEDLNRRFHTIDGDSYVGRWPGSFNTIYPWSEVHSYTNKVRVARSAFSFAKVSDEIKQRYPRPVDTKSDYVIHTYGVEHNNDHEWMMRRLNADLGPTYQIHNLILLFNADQYPSSELENVRNAWQGPNKNELVTCIGISPAHGEIVWCDVFSWMDDTTIHSIVRQEISAIGKYDNDKVLDVLRTNIQKRWKRKQFSEFDYLKISLPAWLGATILVLSLGVSVGGVVLLERKL